MARKNTKLDYIFTPRFAPTCSLKLMQEVAKYAVEHNAWIQTHLAENKDEIKLVQNYSECRIIRKYIKKQGC
jgi:guanine deaminase